MTAGKRGLRLVSSVTPERPTEELKQTYKVTHGALWRAQMVTLGLVGGLAGAVLALIMLVSR